MTNDLTVKNGNTTLFTTIYPNPARETIIFLHGGPGLPDGLTFIEKYLSPYYQIISFHQRGTLRSPAPDNDFSMESYLSDINALAAHFNLSKFHLLGHSWGGLYAQIYLEKNKHRLLSVFLCSPGSGTGLQWAQAQAEIAAYNLSKSDSIETGAMAVQAFLGGLGADKGYQNLYKQLIDNFNRGFPVNQPTPFRLDCVKAKAINLTTKAILKYPRLSHIASPGFPVTLVYGDQDVFGDSKKYVQQRYPSAQITFIPNSGHLSWSHNQEEFVQVLRKHYNI